MSNSPTKTCCIGVSPVLARTEMDLTMDYISSAHFNCYSCEAVLAVWKYHKTISSLHI